MAGKRILIFTNHFFPENFRVNDVAFELAKRNYQVTVLTGIPNYPQGKYYDGYGILRRRKEIIKNVTIIRIPLIPRGKRGLIRLSLNYISYTFCLTFYSLFLALTKKFDLVLVHHTSPIFLGIPAVIFKRLQKVKLIFWNLDLWPESVTETTGLKLNLLIKILEKLVKIIYLNSDRILISSKQFKSSLLDKGVDENKINYFPNWAEDIFIQNNVKKIDLSSYGIPSNNLIIMFAGNIGAAQDVDNLVKAIEITSKQKLKICWVFIGEGRKSEWMKNEIRKLELTDKVFFLGQHPIEHMPSFFASADVMLVSLKDSPIFRLTAPAKIQAYMASAKPILAMINGEGADIIKEANCGLTCNAGDIITLASNAIKLAQMDSRQRIQLGENGIRFYNKHFTKPKIIEQLINYMENLQQK